MAVSKKLLKTLEDLTDDEFKTFKWHLRSIPKCHLENADRLKTVDKIVQIYNQRSVEVVKKILKKIDRNDLVEELSNISRGSHGKLQDINMKLRHDVISDQKMK